VTTTDSPNVARKGSSPNVGGDIQSRLIDHWFPCVSVDAAVETPSGSGLSEKALFTWFASRPIAQARAAVLTALLPDHVDLHEPVRQAILDGTSATLEMLANTIDREYPSGRPVVLDMFSGRGIIPLEAARLGVTTAALDLSPVATLATKILTVYPLIDWSDEPPLPFTASADEPSTNQGMEQRLPVVGDDAEPRLLHDVRILLAEVGRRTLEAVSLYYPKGPTGRNAWGYLWAVSIPCDNCGQRFPLVGSMALRHPYRLTGDPGQSFRLKRREDGRWYADVHDGPPMEEPTYSSATGRRGKSARCPNPSCRHVHSLDSVKQKGFARQYRDELLGAAELIQVPAPTKTNPFRTAERKVFRNLMEEDWQAIEAAGEALRELPMCGPFTYVPSERIPEGNASQIDASGYGYDTFASLMVERQALYTAELVRTIRACHMEMISKGVSAHYALALTSYAAANLVRKLRRSGRGCRVNKHGKPDGSKQNRLDAHDIFANESGITFAFDCFETGPAAGPGTWESVSQSGLHPLTKHLASLPKFAQAARVRCGSALALPYRDGTVDAVITDPAYYEMIAYSDVSDYFYVWLRRVLFDLDPELFADGDLQNKTDEIIHKPSTVKTEHRTKRFFEQSLARAFGEARRVLRPDGHLVVVFGHSDLEAWQLLLSALRAAGFVVTSSWPSRSESANTGVASIKVTVTIGCRVASPNRPVATAAQVDREVAEAVKSSVREWDRDGLALTDQLMAAYGPAMAVYGRYSKVLKPDGSQADLDRYLTLARVTVRDATALRLDELPLETFDGPTRFAVFWQRLYGRADVPKGEARFLAQADNLRIEDMRGPLLTESKSGFKLRLDAPDRVTERSSTFEVVRAMAATWHQGATEAVAAVIAAADRQPTDAHLWAVVGEIVRQVPASDPVAKALTAVQRNVATIATLVQRVASLQQRVEDQMVLDLTYEE
jgi:putative DNA methylase